jgi:hypothetical protein
MSAESSPLYPEYTPEDQIGAAVAGHFILEWLDKRPFPDAGNPDDVQHVRATVALHTTMTESDLAAYEEFIRECMRAQKSEFEGEN